MRRSFYHYLMTLRGPSHLDEEQVFANHVFHDLQFPKQSADYDLISNYLELNSDYIASMDLFDQLWEKYLENNH